MFLNRSWKLISVFERQSLTIRSWILINLDLHALPFGRQDITEWCNTILSDPDAISVATWIYQTRCESKINPSFLYSNIKQIIKLLCKKTPQFTEQIGLSCALLSLSLDAYYAPPPPPKKNPTRLLTPQSSFSFFSFRRFLLTLHWPRNSKLSVYLCADLFLGAHT